MEKNYYLTGNYATELNGKNVAGNFKVGNFNAGNFKAGNIEANDDIQFITESIESMIEGIKRALELPAKLAQQPIEWMRKYFSSVLEREISTKQTWLLLETQAALIMGILPADMHIGLRALFLGWFALCLLKCKERI